MKRMKSTAYSILSGLLLLSAAAPVYAYDVEGSDSSSTEVVIPPATKEKESKPGMKKTMFVGGNEVTDSAVEKGSTVSFKLESNLPDGLLGYATEWTGTVENPVPQGSYILTFHDEMDAAYKDRSELTVKIGETVLAADQYATVLEGEADSCAFHVVLDLLDLYRKDVITDEQIKSAEKITVEYTAVFNPDEKKGGFVNKAWVSGKDVPGTPSEVESDLFELIITKTDTSDPKKPLAGASFKLYKDAQRETQVGEEQTTGENGKILFDGLLPGTYWLYETKAPDGYIRSTEMVEIVINKENNAEFTANKDIENASAPHTGGEGTMIYTIGGTMLLAAGLMIAVARRKIQEQK